MSSQKRNAEEDFWKHECRDILGQERFEDVESEVNEILNRKRPPKIDRARVYYALWSGMATRRGDELFDPEWIRERDDAYHSVEKAIDRLAHEINNLRAVLKRRNLKDDVKRLEVGWEKTEESLKEELKKLRTAKYQSRPGPIDWPANARAKLLSEDRYTLGWDEYRPDGGRPRAVWKEQTIGELRAAGVSINDCEMLIQIAGLLGKTPTDKS